MKYFHLLFKTVYIFFLKAGWYLQSKTARENWVNWISCEHFRALKMNLCCSRYQKLSEKRVMESDLGCNIHYFAFSGECKAQGRQKTKIATDFWGNLTSPWQVVLQVHKTLWNSIMFNQNYCFISAFLVTSLVLIINKGLNVNPLVDI